ncbi:MAG: 3-keto-5-aminohexanoate cleavage protein, partial [Paraglaciecola sp.]|nr:3-keto-5-aminohexanoate cleavage protein [Paraglaciecola sp.]
MSIKGKVIISCAITGSIHTPSMSEFLPITPKEIAKASIEAADAGASILHLHARDPKNGSPTASADVFMEFLPEIKNKTDAIINITTGGSHLMSLEERMEAPKRAKPELCSLKMGPLIFDYSAAANRVKHWKYDWEEKYVKDSYDRVMYNTNLYIE